MLTKYFVPKWFLVVSGTICLLLCILGFIGVLGPTAEKSIFGEMWWFDNAESVAFGVLGAVSLLFAFLLRLMAQRFLVLMLAALGFFFGVYSIFMSDFGPANLENPADTILALVLGVTALWAGMNEPAKEQKSTV